MKVCSFNLEILYVNTQGRSRRGIKGKIYFGVNKKSYDPVYTHRNDGLQIKICIIEKAGNSGIIRKIKYNITQ